LLTWGYYYQDSAADIPATHGPWDVLGMDYTADQTAWDLAKATGKKVIGHIVPDASAAAVALGKGADGLMVAGVRDVIPGPAVPRGGDGGPRRVWGGWLAGCWGAAGPSAGASASWGGGTRGVARGT